MSKVACARRHDAIPFISSVILTAIALSIATATTAPAASLDTPSEPRNVVEGSWSSIIINPVWLPPSPCRLSYCRR